jgi:hypothetical protein
VIVIVTVFLRFLLFCSLHQPSILWCWSELAMRRLRHHCQRLLMQGRLHSWLQWGRNSLLRQCPVDSEQLLPR